ncbi:patatin-like phospholipase family protein [Aneurinibacillus sp. Ricciae_BoGa-3]|uniref:patatin-like phospholipase family protein n=1 Tax=Aneurinibacillus sp. Ricciae_BoGa-3 TaxID=3022697 RepID=UPI002340CB16|nr:patatin-like phospholipase family protein [Aneurinibacillus sp. Ricciae_BoGa-3]WCK54877.1 patatin-like phospholipase family protein [Aneurinibacillus sp. Ricciae_BoGa-3]
MTKVGIALGGGGVVGCAHLGALQALKESGIEIHSIAGTSSGAVVAALYGYGYSPEQLIELIPSLSKRFLDFDYWNFFKRLLIRDVKVRGLIKGRKLHHFVSRLTHDCGMSELKLPVALLSADLMQGRQMILSSRPLVTPCQGAEMITNMSVADAVLASVSIPALFKPVIHQGRFLVDGGIIDNCPIAAVKALGADKVIAVNLVCVEPVKTSFDSLLSIVSRAVSMNLASQAKQLMTKADIILQPEASAIGILDFSKITDCVTSGYEYTRRRINEIKDALGNEYAL